MRISARRLHDQFALKRGAPPQPPDQIDGPKLLTSGAVDQHPREPGQHRPTVIGGNRMGGGQPVVACQIQPALEEASGTSAREHRCRLTSDACMWAALESADQVLIPGVGLGHTSADRDGGHRFVTIEAELLDGPVHRD